MTFTDFEDMATTYFGNNFSNQYWDMGGGKTIGNRRNTYESYRKSYNPVTEHYYEVDTDFDKTGNNYNKFPHKFECGDLVVLDLSNDYYEEDIIHKVHHDRWNLIYFIISVLIKICIISSLILNLSFCS